MKRVTLSDLNELCEELNKMTSCPLETCTRDKDGNFTHNVGNYHLNMAYGGHKIVRNVNTSGGIREITHGFLSKRECLDKGHEYARLINANPEYAKI